MERNYVSLKDLWFTIHADNEVNFEVCFPSMTIKADKDSEIAAQIINVLSNEMSVVGILAEDVEELLIRLCPMTEGAAETILSTAMENEE